MLYAFAGLLSPDVPRPCLDPGPVPISPPLTAREAPPSWSLTAFILALFTRHCRGPRGRPSPLREERLRGQELVSHTVPGTLQGLGQVGFVRLQG